MYSKFGCGQHAELSDLSCADILYEERASLTCRSLPGCMTWLSPAPHSLSDCQSHSELRDPEGLINIKLYNSKDEALLHVLLDVIGILESRGVDDKKQFTVHAILSQKKSVEQLLIMDENILMYTRTLPNIEILANISGNILGYRDHTMDSLQSIARGDELVSQMLLLSLVSNV